MMSQWFAGISSVNVIMIYKWVIFDSYVWLLEGKYFTIDEWNTVCGFHVSNNQWCSCLLFVGWKICYLIAWTFLLTILGGSRDIMGIWWGPSGALGGSFFLTPRWMISNLEKPIVRNGMRTFGVPLWLRKPPCILVHVPSNGWLSGDLTCGWLIRNLAVASLIAWSNANGLKWPIM